MRVVLKIQSFGDIITNSSSEIYTMYDRFGVDAIRKAVKGLVKAINPDIDIDDHVTIDLVPSSSNSIYDESNEEYIEFDEFYNKCFNEWCLDKSNEEILFGFPQWLEDFQDEYRVDNNGMPLWDIEIKPITNLGETIQDSVYKILYAFDHEEVHT